MGEGGLGIGDWRLEIGDLGLGDWEIGRLGFMIYDL
jgi:hypothetical protein